MELIGVGTGLGSMDPVEQSRFSEGNEPASSVTALFNCGVRSRMDLKLEVSRRAFNVELPRLWSGTLADADGLDAEWW